MIEYQKLFVLPCHLFYDDTNERRKRIQLGFEMRASEKRNELSVAHEQGNAVSVTKIWRQSFATQPQLNDIIPRRQRISRYYLGLCDQQWLVINGDLLFSNYLPRNKVIILYIK